MNVTKAGLLFAANWKAAMTPTQTKKFLGAFLPALKERRSRLEETGAQIVIAPPAASLTVARAAIDHDTWARKLPVELAVQDPWHVQGAYTGATTLADALDPAIGAKYAIIGHSETREPVYRIIRKVRNELASIPAGGVETHLTHLVAAIIAEAKIDSDSPAPMRLAFHAVINRLVKEALRVNIVPILCVGESLAAREDGQTVKVVLGQLRKGLSGVSAQDAARVVVAYEPVWAIGTGRTATPDRAQEVHAAIAAELRAAGIEHPTIIHGGSMTADNVASLVGQPYIHGGLIDGASLDPTKFIALIDEGLAA